MFFLYPSSCPAFAPRQLRRFIATMRALTPRCLSRRHRGLPTSRTHDSERPATNHLMHPCRRFFAPLQYSTCSRAFVLLARSLFRTLWVSPYASRLTGASSRIVFVSCWPFVPFPLLSTSSYDDAVTSRYKPERFSLRRTCTSLHVCARWRTGMGILSVKYFGFEIADCGFKEEKNHKGYRIRRDFRLLTPDPFILRG